MASRDNSQTRQVTSLTILLTGGITPLSPTQVVTPHWTVVTTSPNTHQQDSYSPTHIDTQENSEKMHTKIDGPVTLAVRAETHVATLRVRSLCSAYCHYEVLFPSSCKSVFASNIFKVPCAEKGWPRRLTTPPPKAPCLHTPLNPLHRCRRLHPAAAGPERCGSTCRQFAASGG